MFKDTERSPNWDIRQIFPSQSDEHIAKNVAEFFQQNILGTHSAISYDLL